MTAPVEPLMVEMVAETPEPPKARRTRRPVAASEGVVNTPGETESDAFGENVNVVSVETSTPVVATLPKLSKEEPKTGAPSVAEWQDFLGRVVIRGMTNAYLILAIGEADLSPAEFESIKLTPEDLNEMSAPLASLANKSKLARKHGRLIISTGDSWEAVLAMFMWVRQVNRISRKHRKQRQARPVQGTVIGQGENLNGDFGQDDGAGADFSGPGFNIYNPGTG